MRQCCECEIREIARKAKCGPCEGFDEVNWVQNGFHEVDKEEMAACSMDVMCDTTLSHTESWSGTITVCPSVRHCDERKSVLLANLSHTL